MTSSTSSRKSPAASTDPTLDDSTVETPAPAVDSAPAADTVPAISEAPAPASDSNKVKIKLAHPLDKKEDLRTLGLAPKEGGYKPLDEIEVTKAGARTLISAGYAAYVDPENAEAVAAALNPSA